MAKYLNLDGLQTLWAKLKDTFVHKTGSETIAGEKTFSSTIKGSVSGSAGSLAPPPGTTKGYVETNETNTGCRLKLCDSSRHELRFDSFGSSESKWRMSVYADNTGEITKQVMLVDKTTGNAEFLGKASSASSADKSSDSTKWSGVSLVNTGGYTRLEIV